MKKVYIRTFGCQMNEYDSEKMLSVLAQNDDLEQGSEPEQADIILFNTCSVREKAQEKVFSDLGRIKHLKQKNFFSFKKHSQFTQISSTIFCVFS